MLEWTDKAPEQKYSLQELDELLKLSIFYYKLAACANLGLDYEQSQLITNHLMISADGCFKIQKVKNKAHGGQITFGKTYFATNVPAGLRTLEKPPVNPQKDVVPQKDVMTQKDVICSTFKANVGSLGRTLEKTHDVTGLFGTVCSRHAIPVPETFSDIAKGEK